VDFCTPRGLEVYNFILVFDQTKPIRSVIALLILDSGICLATTLCLGGCSLQIELGTLTATDLRASLPGNVILGHDMMGAS
jgi:hypothetical protein